MLPSKDFPIYKYTRKTGGFFKVIPSFLFPCKLKLIWLNIIPSRQITLIPLYLFAVHPYSVMERPERPSFVLNCFMSCFVICVLNNFSILWLRSVLFLCSTKRIRNKRMDGVANSLVKQIVMFSLYVVVLVKGNSNLITYCYLKFSSKSFVYVVVIWMDMRILKNSKTVIFFNI